MFGETVSLFLSSSDVSYAFINEQCTHLGTLYYENDHIIFNHLPAQWHICLVFPRGSVDDKYKTVSPRTENGN